MEGPVYRLSIVKHRKIYEILTSESEDGADLLTHDCGFSIFDSNTSIFEQKKDDFETSTNNEDADLFQENYGDRGHCQIIGIHSGSVTKAFPIIKIHKKDTNSKNFKKFQIILNEKNSRSFVSGEKVPILLQNFFVTCNVFLGNKNCFIQIVPDTIYIFDKD